MKIWIDFINTPQVSFWVPFITDFRINKHELILTCRDSGNTIELLKQHGLDYEVIGKMAGNGILQKLLLFPKRIFQLYSFISKRKPDIAISQSSFYQPIVASMLHIPCLYTNDNEFAKGNLAGFIFAKAVLLPVALSDKKFIKKWPLKSKVSFYPSVKEAIYLSQHSNLIQHISRNKSTIMFRPEPWTAQYYKGPVNFFDDILLKLAMDYNIIILPRGPKQVIHYKQDKFNKLMVAETPLNLKEILSSCKLFIGAGGSMTREMAVLGIPVISVYQSDLLCVDRYLEKRGRIIIKPDITPEEIKLYLLTENELKNDLSILNEGKESYLLFKRLIASLYRDEINTGSGTGIINKPIVSEFEELTVYEDNNAR